MKTNSLYFSCAQKRFHNQHHLKRDIDFGNNCYQNMKFYESETFNSFEMKQKIDESSARLNTKNEDTPSLNKVIKSSLKPLPISKQQDSPDFEVYDDSKYDSIHKISEIEDSEWIPQDLSLNNTQSECAIELIWHTMPEDQHSNQTQIRISAQEHDSSLSNLNHLESHPSNDCEIINLIDRQRINSNKDSDENEASIPQKDF